MDLFYINVRSIKDDKQNKNDIWRRHECVCDEGTEIILNIGSFYWVSSENERRKASIMTRSRTSEKLLEIHQITSLSSLFASLKES